MNNHEQLVAKAKELGAAAASVVKTADIQFAEKFRAMCEQNVCGKYDTNWGCPPGAGTFEELKTRVLGFSAGVVFQTVHQVEDSSDLKGMERAQVEHKETLRHIEAYLAQEDGCGNVLVLSAGGCTVCEECSYKDGEDCRCPDQAIGSLSAHCINVERLLATYGIPYNNGPNTVSFVALFLFGL